MIEGSFIGAEQTDVHSRPAHPSRSRFLAWSILFAGGASPCSLRLGRRREEAGTPEEVEGADLEEAVEEGAPEGEAPAEAEPVAEAEAAEEPDTESADAEEEEET